MVRSGLKHDTFHSHPTLSAADSWYVELTYKKYYWCVTMDCIKKMDDMSLLPPTAPVSYHNPIQTPSRQIASLAVRHQFDFQGPLYLREVRHLCSWYFPPKNTKTIFMLKQEKQEKTSSKLKQWLGESLLVLVRSDNRQVTCESVRTGANLSDCYTCRPAALCLHMFTSLLSRFLFFPWRLVPPEAKQVKHCVCIYWSFLCVIV